MNRVPRLVFYTLLTLGTLLVVVDLALLAVRLAWPEPRIVPGENGLAAVRITGIGEHVAMVRATASSGRLLRGVYRSRAIVPEVKLRGGQLLRVQATVHRSKWLGWLLGRTETGEASVRTPVATLVDTLVYPAPGSPVAVRFSRPVQVVSLQMPARPRPHPTLPAPPPPLALRRLPPSGPAADAANRAGTALVAGAPRAWERLPEAARVSWFPPGPKPHVLVRPALDAPLGPSAPIVLTFSRPVDDVLGAARPLLR